MACMKPFHCGRLTLVLKTNEDCQRKSIPSDTENVFGQYSSIKGLNLIIDKDPMSGPSYHINGIFGFDDISDVVSKDLILFMRNELFITLSLYFIEAAIIPIPCIVFLPSRVHILWSILSATH